MYDSESLKVLLGNSIEEPEVDYDDAKVQSETGYPVEESALQQFYYVTVTDNMGKPDFKSNYLSVINQIKTYPPEEQRSLSLAILQKIPEVYDFEFSINFNPDSPYEIYELYLFLEFVEYNHEKFILDVWSNIKPDSKSIHIQNFCEQNQVKILKEIEEQLESHYYPRLIADFLRTYNKDELVEWFCEKSKNLYTSILLNLREENSNV